MTFFPNVRVLTKLRSLFLIIPHLTEPLLQHLVDILLKFNFTSSNPRLLANRALSFPPRESKTSKTGIKCDIPKLMTIWIGLGGLGGGSSGRFGTLHLISLCKIRLQFDMHVSISLKTSFALKLQLLWNQVSASINSHSVEYGN